MFSSNFRSALLLTFLAAVALASNSHVVWSQDSAVQKVCFVGEIRMNLTAEEAAKLLKEASLKQQYRNAADSFYQLDGNRYYDTFSRLWFVFNSSPTGLSISVYWIVDNSEYAQRRFERIELEKVRQTLGVTQPSLIRVHSNIVRFERESRAPLKEIFAALNGPKESPFLEVRRIDSTNLKYTDELLPSSVLSLTLVAKDSIRTASVNTDLSTGITQIVLESDNTEFVSGVTDRLQRLDSQEGITTLSPKVVIVSSEIEQKIQEEYTSVTKSRLPGGTQASDITILELIRKRVMASQSTRQAFDSAANKFSVRFRVINSDYKSVSLFVIRLKYAQNGSLESKEQILKIDKPNITVGQDPSANLIDIDATNFKPGIYRIVLSGVPVQGGTQNNISQREYSFDGQTFKDL